MRSFEEYAMKYEIIIEQAEECTDYATLAALGGCSDNGDSLGLCSYQVNFRVKVVREDGDGQHFNITYQSEERTEGLRNYLGWEMDTCTAVDDDCDALETFLDYDTDEAYQQLRAHAMQMAKEYFERMSKARP